MAAWPWQARPENTKALAGDVGDDDVARLMAPSAYEQHEHFVVPGADRQGLDAPPEVGACVREWVYPHLSMCAFLHASINAARVCIACVCILCMCNAHSACMRFQAKSFTTVAALRHHVDQGDACDALVSSINCVMSMFMPRTFAFCFHRSILLCVSIGAFCMCIARLLGRDATLRCWALYAAMLSFPLVCNAISGPSVSPASYCFFAHTPYK